MKESIPIFDSYTLIFPRWVFSILLIGLPLLMGNCVVENVNLKESSDVRLLKAKDWFEVNEKFLRNNGTPSNHSEAMKAAISKLNKTPDWDRHLIHVGKRGEEVWEIPLIYDGLFIGVREGKPFPKSVYHSMVMFSSGNEFKAFILKIIPDDPEYIFKDTDYLSVNYSKIREDFSGDFKFFEWDESFIGGYIVEKGQIVRHTIRKN